MLALACGFYHDPYQGPFGTVFPGITGADNLLFAANILRWLAGNNLRSRDRTVEAFELVDHIERSFLEYMHRKLCAAYADNWWTEGIPVEIRKKCAERCEEEGNKLPKPAYLDLLDSKNIVDKNWQAFEQDFNIVGWRGGKRAALGWFTRLNELRKNVMHPTRRHFVPTLVAQEDVVWLRQLHTEIQKLLELPSSILVH